MNILFRSVVLISLLMGAWCCAESFLITHKPEKRRTAGQLKEDIVEVMAELLENQTVHIELSAQIQNVLCKHIRAIAHQDKGSSFKKAGVPDLHRLLKQLQNECERYRKECSEDQRFLASLRSFKSQQDN